MCWGVSVLSGCYVSRGRQALQSVGNLGLQLGHGKEQWMAPLHPIILRSVASVKDFLDKLIDIDHDIGKAENCEHAATLVITRRGGHAVELISRRPAAVK